MATKMIGTVLFLGAAGAIGIGCSGSGTDEEAGNVGASSSALVNGTGDGGSPSVSGPGTGDGSLPQDASAPDDGQRLATAFGDPLPGLSGAEQARFQAGKEEFLADEGIDDGLGPVFNDTACARCHSVPATGGGSAVLETRFGKAVRGGFDPLAALGGSLVQARGIGPAGSCNYTGETVPRQATVVAQRRTTPLFGLGLVDAVPETTFRDLARLEARSSPDTAGRVGIVHDIANDRDAVGRFGWKCQVPTLHQFAGDAYLNEMGITNPEFPDENCPQGDCALLACNPVPGLNDDGSGVTAFGDFMTFLAPPPRGPVSRDAARGQQLFARAGCAACHTPTLTTGAAASPALSRVTFHPYSDFLLHDMGSLGDGVELGSAKGNEFRTAPLWGVGVMTSFLHDGRAPSLADAIRAHDGQARRARDRFVALPAADQTALVDFVKSL